MQTLINEIRTEIRRVKHRRLTHSTLPSHFLIFVVALITALMPSGFRNAYGEVAAVAVRVSQDQAWVGQRLPFFVELRSSGSFAGAASFDLPQLPGVILMKIGNPVVGSQNIDGDSWFVQTHEFALFSQRSGAVVVPPFPVRFSRRDGFTGPVSDVSTDCPSLTAQIQRPPSTVGIGFLMTTESLDVSESWDPPPAPVKVGAIFKRTIVLSASQLSGMALAPAPVTGPDGIRIYSSPPQTSDRLERGEFQGERRETITYLFTQAGTLSLPAINYVWWNPKSKSVESKTLPAVTFEIASVPTSPSTSSDAEVDVNSHFPLWVVAIAVLLLGGSITQRKRLTNWRIRLWDALNPSDLVAVRSLLKASRRHEAVAAEAAWNVWRNTQEAELRLGLELASAVLELQQHRYGPKHPASWTGDELHRAFIEHLAARKQESQTRRKSDLPLLNPQD